jgi:T-complex protein 1 subunit theta
MSKKNQMGFGNPGGFSGLLKDGYKHMQGVDEATLRNIEACKQLAAKLRTSLGPQGAARGTRARVC